MTSADEVFLRKFRTGRNVLGVALQLCTLPWLGFVPDEVPAAPAAAVGRLSQRLGTAMGEVRVRRAEADPRRPPTRGRRVRPVDTGEWKGLDEFPFARAMDARLAEVAVPAGG